MFPTFPTLLGETLTERAFKLPADFHEKSTWLIIGFTRESQKASAACAEKLEQDFKGKGWSVAELQGVPFFIKGIIKNGIRSSVSKSRHDRYLVLFEGKDELKRLAAFDEKHEDDAYVLGLRASSPESYEVIFATHGECGQADYFRTKELIQGLGK
jgi:hypothetical protein